MAEGSGGASLRRISHAFRGLPKLPLWETAESWGNDHLLQFLAKCLWRKNGGISSKIPLKRSLAGAAVA